jgi:hypothetical protein
MRPEVANRWKLALALAAVLVWWGLLAATGNASSPRPVYHRPPGYENPAPGNDGTPDCPPGGGPVYVGSTNPNGFDGDGDGLGCEG